ncbi:MAG: metallophosphoesterase [Clostridia bacterium]|nr:metallophosphoesterase [Clostridia bacterium]
MGKKLTALLLAALLLMSALPVGASDAAPAVLRLAVASDLHYNQPREALEGEIDDPVYWYANRRAAMEDESGFLIDEFLRQCAENDCDYVLISGDLADNGRSLVQEHLDVAEKLRQFEADSGKEVFVIDGNHDLGAGDAATTVESFMEIYADFGFDHALATLPGTCSYTADLGSDYRLIAADSCDPTVSTEDGMTSDRVQWVCDQADKAYADGRYPLLMMHHNLLDHMPLQRVFSHNFIVRNHLTTAARFADHGIHLVLTGHEHCSDASKYISARGNVIYDFATTSLTMYPLQYRFLTLTPDAIDYEAKTLEAMDLDALTAAVEGYTDAQLSPMQADLNAYAKGFLKAGVQYRLALGLSMEKLGIAEDAIYYDLVNTAVSRLLELLEMPLYGEGSVQALAKEYGIDLPETPYATGWDLATELVAWHYAGEEPFDLESDEVTVLLRMVALILQDDLSGVNDAVFFKAANQLLGGEGVSRRLTKAASRLYGGVTAGEYFLLALVAPILDGFGCDSDGVNDNHGTLPGYAAQPARMTALAEKWQGVAAALVQDLTWFLHYTMKMIVR